VHRSPHPLGRRRHRHIGDAERGQRVEDRVHHGWRRSDRTPFADALDAGRVGRAGHPAPSRRSGYVLSPIDGRQRQPGSGKERPWAHRDDDNIRPNHLAVDLDAFDPSRPSPHSSDPAEPQFCAVALGRPHHDCCKQPRKYVGGAPRRPQPLAHPHARRDPIDELRPDDIAGLIATGGKAAIGIKTAVSPVAPNLLCQLSVQVEAMAGKRLKRSSIAPVASQKAARFPDAAQATPVRSTTSALMPRQLRKLLEGP
jgi:hypothetical protein